MICYTRRCGAPALAGLFFLVMLLAAVAGPQRALAQQTVSLAAFSGTWHGSGIAKDLGDYFGGTVRDLNVVIRVAGGGFTIDWATVSHQGTGTTPKVKRKEASQSFTPTAIPNVFRAASSGDPLAGGAVTWARLERNTLSVYQLQLNAQGRYELTRYDRTLGVGGMDLVFTRYRENEEVRSVAARLVKVGD